MGSNRPQLNLILQPTQHYWLLLLLLCVYDHLYSMFTINLARHVSGSVLLVVRIARINRDNGRVSIGHVT